MSPNLKPEDLLQGVTFASGGTGYDPLTAKMMVRYNIFSSLTLASYYKLIHFIIFFVIL